MGPAMSTSALLARSLATALDPVLLARRSGIEPDPWQSRLLRSQAPQKLLLCSRQAGKSTVAAVLAVYQALHHAPALVLLLAPALRQAQELFRRVRDVLAALGSEVPPIVVETTLALEFSTGSRIVCLPGKEATVRGFSSVALLVVDEAARVQDDLYQAIRPMLAVSGGRIVLLSTPFGKRGFFHFCATEGGSDWERAIVTALECPRIDPAWLATERDRIGDWWYRQEYMCEFVETDDQVFSYDAVMGALSDDVTPLFALDGSLP